MIPLPSCLLQPQPTSHQTLLSPFQALKYKLIDSGHSLRAVPSGRSFPSPSLPCKLVMFQDQVRLSHLADASLTTQGRSVALSTAPLLCDVSAPGILLGSQAGGCHAHSPPRWQLL